MLGLLLKKKENKRQRLEEVCSRQGEVLKDKHGWHGDRAGDEGGGRGPACEGTKGEGRGETRSLLRGKGPDTGVKEKHEESKGQARKWTWWGRMWGRASEWEQVPGRWLPPSWKVSSGFPGPPQ